MFRVVLFFISMSVLTSPAVADLVRQDGYYRSAQGACVMMADDPTKEIFFSPDCLTFRARQVLHRERSVAEGNVDLIMKVEDTGGKSDRPTVFQYRATQADVAAKRDQVFVDGVRFERIAKPEGNPVFLKIEARRKNEVFAATDDLSICVVTDQDSASAEVHRVFIGTGSGMSKVALVGMTARQNGVLLETARGALDIGSDGGWSSYRGERIWLVKNQRCVIASDGLSAQIQTQ